MDQFLFLVGYGQLTFCTYPNLFIVDCFRDSGTYAQNCAGQYQ